MATVGKSITDNHDFIALMKKRDIRAMEILYDQYSQVLYGVIYWITNDEKKSEEILFRTFTYVWNHYNSFDVSVQNFCLWMLHVARNYCFETLNKEDRLKVKDQWLAFLREHGENEQLEMLGYAFFRGLSVKEMAFKFNCSESAIRSQLHEAVGHLKKGIRCQMNVKEIIESGVIELYCLGIASEEERLLVEQLAKENVLLREEIASVNDALANYAVSVSSVLPPQNLKQKILSSIQSSGSTAPLSNLPPTLTDDSTPGEWLEYLDEQNIKEPEEHEDVIMIELPGTEDYYTYLVFAKPGGIVNEETHFGHHEYLLICEGECEMTIAGKKFRYKTGDFLSITPGTPHSAIVTGTQRMIVIGQRRAA